MANQLYPFRQYGNTVNIASVGTAGTDRVALSTPPPNSPRFAVRVFNAGVVTVFINFGSSTATASASTGFPVPAGSVEVFSAFANTDSVANPVYAAAVVASGSTGPVYFTNGEGI